MGSSSGGFAALAYGCRYNAHRVFAISPQVDFRAGFYDALDARRGGVFTRPLRYREEEYYAERDHAGRRRQFHTGRS